MIFNIILAVIFSLALVGVIFFGTQSVFFTVGAIGGCMFIWKMAMESLFPNLFKKE